LEGTRAGVTRSDSVKLPSIAGDRYPESSPLQLEAFACYRGLVAHLSEDASKAGLGGKLLYAGELDRPGRAVTVAGNVAGCASFAVSADPAAQKQAIHDGVVDFVVTSLDEALRILKNEIRKRSSVAVCIASEHGAIEQEMRDRGVLPDLVFAGFSDHARSIVDFGAAVREIRLGKPDEGAAVIAWEVIESPTRWMQKLDAIAFAFLSGEAWLRRWLQLSPRYFGRGNLGKRAFFCDPQIAIEIVKGFKESVESGAIAAAVSVRLMIGGETKLLELLPPAQD
jgi:urocanate hydratase